MGKITQFAINFENPQSSFKAGQTIIGTVVLSCNEPIKVERITLKFFGKAKVHWTKTKSSGRSSSTYHYRGEEIYFDKTFLLFRSTGDDSATISAGTHSYNFHFETQPGLPSSFEGEFGYVRYFAFATAGLPWKFDKETKKPFTINSILDLNTERGALSIPIRGEKNEEIWCCCVSGRIEATVCLNKRGFVPGEVLCANAEIQNHTNTEIQKVKLELKQFIKFYGISDALFSSHTPKPKERERIVAVAQKGPIPSGGTQTWQAEGLRIPPVPPSRLVGCQIIDISYQAILSVEPDCGDKVRMTANIIIGTEPLRQVRRPEPPPVAASAPPAYEELVNDATPRLEPFEDELSPPSYEDCVFGRANYREEGESSNVEGDLSYAPRYPIWRLPSEEGRVV